MGQVREANARLQQHVHRLRDEYLRNVSHGFGLLTPTAATPSSCATQGVPSDTSLREVMGVLLDSSDQMIDMVDTLLEVSRIEQGETGRRLDIRSVALRELLETALASVRGLAEKKGATIDISELPGTPGDRGRPLLAGPCLEAPLEQRAQRRRRPSRCQLGERHLSRSTRPHRIVLMADGGLDRRREVPEWASTRPERSVRLHQGTIEGPASPDEAACSA